MATKDDQEILRLLVQHVARSFYEPKYTIIMDQLSRHPVLKDDDLAGRMGLQPKELNKIIAVLANDCLVKIYRQNELKEGAQRSVGKQYYYIDYRHFCNVIKWRVSHMRKKIDSNLRNELDNKGYICPQCKQSYSTLDADRLFDFTRNMMVCEICHAEVIDNENAENVQGSKDRMQRFNHQMRFIREGLQKSESMVLPAFDVAAWVKNNFGDPEKQKAAQPGPGLKIAGSDSTKTDEDGIGVMITMDKDETTRKMERDAEAEAKRQQNVMPSWHLKSTITGDLTALGVKEHARIENHKAVSRSNDDILRGLGVVGGKAQDPTPMTAMTFVEETKPVINHEADYYDQYYASLAASANVSGYATPSASAPASSDYGDLNIDDEEEQKPSVEYLDSLNDYRKRSRSREDEGMKQTKLPKLGEEYMNGFSPEAARPNGSANGHPEMAAEDASALPLDDPIIYVNGAPVPFSGITEEHHELMTPDEYTAYFNVLQDRSGM
ncbi:TFIIE alpha subunit domain containing protein [Amanita muscaria]